MLEYCLDILQPSQWVMASACEWEPPMPFKITEVGRFYSGKNYSTKRSDKAGYYILYTKSGEGVVEKDGVSVTLLPQSAILVDCQKPHWYGNVSDTTWVNYWIHLDGAGVAAYYPLLEWKAVNISDTSACESVFESLITLAESMDIYSSFKMSHELSQLLNNMLCDSQGQLAVGTGKNQKSMTAVCKYIASSYHQQITINDMCAKANFSKFHFVRLFRQYTGSTPYQYLCQYRIGKAKQLLCTTTLNIAEIGWQVGFTSESNFIHQFRQNTGVTPANFRKTNLGV